MTIQRQKYDTSVVPLPLLDCVALFAGFNRDALLAARSDERTCARSVAFVWLLGFAFHGVVFYVMGLQFSLSQESAVTIALLATAMIGFFDRVIIVGTNKARALGFSVQQRLSIYSMRESWLRVLFVMTLRIGCIVVLINMVSTTLPPVMFAKWLAPEFAVWQQELDADFKAEAKSLHEKKGELLDEEIAQVKVNLGDLRKVRKTQVAQEQAMVRASIENNNKTLSQIALLERKVVQQQDSRQVAEQLMACETYGSATQICKELGASLMPKKGKNFFAASEQKRLADARLAELTAQISSLKTTLYVSDEIKVTLDPQDQNITELETKLGLLFDKKIAHVNSQTSFISEFIEFHPQRMLLATQDPSTQWQAINRLKEKDRQFARNFLAMELTVGLFECLVFALVLISPMGKYHFYLARLIVEDLIETHTQSAYLHETDADVRQNHRSNVDADIGKQYSDKIWRIIQQQLT